MYTSHEGVRYEWTRTDTKDTNRFPPEPLTTEVDFGMSGDHSQDWVKVKAFLLALHG